MYSKPLLFLLIFLVVVSSNNLQSEQSATNESKSIKIPQDSKLDSINNNSFKTVVWICVGFGITFVIFGLLILWLAKKYQCYYAEQEFFEDQKAKRNNVNNLLMSQQIFQSHRKRFMQSSWNFRFWKGNKNSVVSNYCVKMTKASKFCYQIIMEGQDILGRWNGIGYYLHKENGIEIWVKKNYIQKINKTKTKYWKRLFFQGKLGTDGNYTGKWYIMGLQQNSAHTGLWDMILLNTQEISAPTMNSITP